MPIYGHIGRAGQLILTGSANPPDDITRHSGAGRMLRVRMRPMSLFESLVVRDLRIYGQAAGCELSHYRDSDGLEVDAVVRRPDGSWIAVEVKLGGETGINRRANAQAPAEQGGRRPHRHTVPPRRGHRRRLRPTNTPTASPSPGSPHSAPESPPGSAR